MRANYLNQLSSSGSPSLKARASHHSFSEEKDAEGCEQGTHPV